MLKRMFTFILILALIFTQILIAVPATEAYAEGVIQTFEAENADINTGGVGDSSNASGGKVVNGLGKDSGSGYDGYIQFNHINVPSDGKYLLHIYYQTAQFRPLDITLNGGPDTVRVYCNFETANDWNTIYCKTVKVDLNSGENTLRLGAVTDAWCPNLDRIEIEPDTVFSCEAENPDTNAVELGGGASPATGLATFSGNAGVQGLGGNDGYVLFKNIEATRDGYYEIKVYYSTAQDRAFDILVNDRLQYRLNCPKTDSSDWYIQGSASIIVRLNRGSNTLKFYNRASNGWCPVLDKIEVEYSLNQKPDIISIESDDPANMIGPGVTFGDWSLCSGGKTTSSGLGSETEGYIEFRGIQIPRTGYYRLSVFSGYYGNSSFDAKVNNLVNSQIVSTDEYNIPTVDTGSWWTSNKSFKNIYLTEGEKSIRFFKKEGSGPTLDKIELQLIQPLSFEAESAENRFSGSARFTESADCSGGLEVEGLGGGISGGSVEFDGIQVDKAGTYIMNVHYSTGEQRSFDILVNDTEEYSLTCEPSAGWWTPAFKPVTITLKQGLNKIKFYNKLDNGWCPGLDKIDLMFVENAPANAIVLEAEDALGASAEGLTVDNAPNCSGGKSVSGIDGKYVLFDDVSVPFTGLYELKVSYVNGDESGLRKFDIQINDTDTYTADCPPNTTWGEWTPGDMTLQVYLVKGRNDVKFLKAVDAWCPALDKIELKLAKKMEYEAESDINTFSGSTLFAWEACSGGMTVQSMGNGPNGGSLTFNGVNVDADGIYTLKVFYGTETLRWFDILVNDTDAYELECTPTSDWWTPDNPKTIAIRLKAGDNTLKFYNKNVGEWCPSLDKIEIKPGGTLDPGDTSKLIFEAEDPNNDRTSGTRLAQSSDFSGGYSVELIGHGENGQSLTFKNIQIAEGKGGIYTLTVDYATLEPRVFDIIVNGDTSNKIRLECPSTGWWWTPGSVSTLITLQEGINTIKFYGEDPDKDCPGLDRIILQEGNVIDNTLRFTIPETGFVSIEAEDSENIRNRKAYVANSAVSSGGKYVAGLGSGGYVQVNGIEAPEDGYYLVNVYYTSPEDRPLDLLVNDKEIYRIYCENSGGNDKLASQAGVVVLKKGYNKIKFFSNEYIACPNLDKIEISKYTIPDAGSANEYQAVSPGNELGGGAQIWLNGQEAFAANLGGGPNKGYVQFNDIDVAEDGKYNLAIYYSCTEFRTLDVTTNGVSSQKVFCYPTGGIYLMQPLNMAVDLKAGRNIIKLDNATGVAPNIEKIVILGKAAPDVSNERNIVTFGTNSVQIEYDLASGTADYIFNGSKKVTGAYSMVKSDRVITSKEYTQRTYTEEDVNDNFGIGKKVTVVNSAQGLPDMKQIFYLYDDKGYFLMEVKLESDAELSSNLMAPIVAEGTGVADIGTGTDNRMLYMAYDNDMYHDMPVDKSVNREGISYEVSALYDNASRNGLVFGSVTHDFWKTGIAYKGSGNKIDMLSIFGGVISRLDTDDICPHGSQVGKILTSPRIFMGFFEDWRKGMEEFAEANTNIVPAKEWSGVKPIGWNSWGAFHTGMTFDDAMKSSDYLKAKLQDNNYHGENGITYMNLDAWSTNVEVRMDEFIAKIKANNQKLGMYLSPFCYWGDDMEAKVPNIKSDYKWGDLVLKTYDGKYYPKQEGTLYHPLDPTHPGTKELVKYYFDKYKEWGVEYVKLDFMNGASCEGQHYDPNVRTGVQAFNEAMKLINENAKYDDGREMFLQLELSPYFPYQYSHAHLLTSDIHHGSMFTSKYVLSSTTYGWWRGKLVPWIDAGIFTLEETDNVPLSDEELARTRVNSLVVSGSLFLVCVDPDRPDHTMLAEKYLTNKEIMDLARVNKPFMPVEGATGSEPADIFVYEDGNANYIGVFNLDDTDVVKTVYLDRAGLDAGANYIARDLWTGQEQEVKGSFTVNLKKYQSTILKLTKEAPSDDPGNPNNPGNPSNPNNPNDPVPSDNPSNPKDPIPSEDSSIADGSVTVTGSLITVEAEKSENGEVSVEIQASDLEKSISNALAEGKNQVTVNIDAAKDATGYKVILPADFIDEDGTPIEIRVETPAGNITMPLEALKEQVRPGEKIEISVVPTEDGKGIKIGLKSGGRNIRLSKPARVEFAYQPPKEALDSEHIVVLRLDEASGEMLPVPSGRYDEKTGMVRFNTNGSYQYFVSYAQKTFDDIKDINWARRMIEVLASKGIIKGTGKGSFSPRSGMKRADFVLLLVRMLELEADTDTNFKDVSRNAYYHDALAIAKKLGLVNGTGNGNFNPEDQISRQDVMVLAAKALEIAGLNLKSRDFSVLDKFADADKIKDYAKEYIAALVKEGIILGDGERLNPDDNISRAEAVAIIYRIYSLIY